MHGRGRIEYKSEKRHRERENGEERRERDLSNTLICLVGTRIVENGNCYI